MVEAHVDGGLQQHIRALAQAVLQHLFYPVLLRHSVRRRRMLLREAYIERASVSGIASAAESALISASVVGLLLSCDERSGTSPMRGGSSNQDESVPRHTRSTSAISSSSSMCTTLRPSRPMLPYPSKDGGVAPRAPPAFLQQLSMVLSEDGIASQRVRLHIALEGETVYWETERGHSVFLLLNGEVRQTTPKVTNAAATSAAAATESTPTTGERGKEDGVEPKAAAAAAESPAAAAPAALTEEDKQNTSVDLNQSVLRSLLPPTPYRTPRDVKAAQEYVSEEISSPAVLGELAAMGGFPYGSTVEVTSEVAAFVVLSRLDYCRLVNASSYEVQKALLYEALCTRQSLLPYFAPMTPERLRLCSFFRTFPSGLLNDILRALIPRVYPAGAPMGEGEQPKHIFFIRRGVVRREPDPMSYHDAADVQCDRPRNQSLLVEGNTFGELACAFRETLRDNYFAVTNVDVYLLPYSVLENLMQHYPVIREMIETRGRTLYDLRCIISAGLKFSPTLADPRTFIQGVIPRDASIITSFRKLSGLKRLTNTSPGTSTTQRRVTIANDNNTTTSGPGLPRLTGGRTSTEMLEIIQKIPVIHSVTPLTFSAKCSSLWSCTRYECGEVIVRRGKECNYLAFFYYGRAGVVIDEVGYQKSGASPQTVIPIPAGHMVGYTCTRRHRWTRTIVALDPAVEVWLLKRSHLVSLLRQFDAQDAVNTAVLQLLQPLYFPPAPSSSDMPSAAQQQQKQATAGAPAPPPERLVVLDMQPILRPMPNSLWAAHTVPNLHPVSLMSTSIVFPVWAPGDFPLGHSIAAEHSGRSSRRASRQVTSSLRLESSRGTSQDEDLPQAAATRVMRSESSEQPHLSHLESPPVGGAMQPLRLNPAESNALLASLSSS